MVKPYLVWAGFRKTLVARSLLLSWAKNDFAIQTANSGRGDLYGESYKNFELLGFPHNFAGKIAGT
jgi:hypothetical protein